MVGLLPASLIGPCVGFLNLIIRKGKFRYEKVFGLNAPTEKITTNTTFRLASCTKLMASIAAIQCVERGRIALDDDVSAILTELKDIQILTGLRDGGPIIKKAETKITLQ